MLPMLYNEGGSFGGWDAVGERPGIDTWAGSGPTTFPAEGSVAPADYFSPVDTFEPSGSAVTGEQAPPAGDAPPPAPVEVGAPGPVSEGRSEPSGDDRSDLAEAQKDQQEVRREDLPSRPFAGGKIPTLPEGYAERNAFWSLTRADDTATPSLMDNLDPSLRDTLQPFIDARGIPLGDSLGLSGALGGGGGRVLLNGRLPSSL